MSKTFDYIAHGGDDQARAEATVEYTAGALGREIDENQKLRAENERLRKGIQDYLDGNWGERLPSKLDKCPHGCFGWEACENCIDEYFAKLLNPQEG